MSDMGRRRHRFICVSLCCSVVCILGICFLFRCCDLLFFSVIWPAASCARFVCCFSRFLYLSVCLFLLCHNAFHCSVLHPLHPLLCVGLSAYTVVFCSRLLFARVLSLVRIFVVEVVLRSCLYLLHALVFMSLLFVGTSLVPAFVCII